MSEKSWETQGSFDPGTNLEVLEGEASGGGDFSV